MPAGTTNTTAEARLGRDVQDKIGQQLRAMYEDVVRQGVPERFTELLNRLDGDGDKINRAESGGDKDGQ
jgi:hypothetical protein